MVKVGKNPKEADQILRDNVRFTGHGIGTGITIDIDDFNDLPFSDGKTTLPGYEYLDEDDDDDE